MEEKEEAKQPGEAAEEATQTTEEPETKESEAAPAQEEPEKETPEPAPVDEAAAWKDKYLRTLADFDNFRKRTARDREDLFKQAAADVIKDVVGTVDNLARALEGADAGNAFVKGVKMVYDGLLQTLAGHGATPLDSIGEPLDPNFHQAIAKVPDAKVPEDHIVAEVKRGWMLNGKLLRAAQVVVSAGAPEPAPEAAPADGQEVANG